MSTAPSNSNSNSDSVDHSDEETATNNPSTDTAVKSSYYFFKSTPASEAVKYLPTPISSSSAASSSSSPSPSPEPVVPHAGSRWNAAGTWEEKDLSSWAHNRLSSLLSNLPLSPLSDVSPSSSSSLDYSILLSSSKVEGDATVVFTRGKKKSGYDLKVVADWVATPISTSNSSSKLTGTIELPSLDQTNEGDFEMIVLVKEREGIDEILVEKIHKHVKNSKGIISKKVSEFESELREQ